MNLQTYSLGIDIDNTILPETKEFMTYIQENINPSFQYKNWNTWDIFSLVDEQQKEKMTIFLKSFFSEDSILHQKPMNYAKEFLELFQADNIYYITARSTWLFEDPKQETTNWISYHSLPYIENNVILESEFIFGQKTPKELIAKELEIDAFFEDHPTNAINIAKIGCPVFLIDYPFNRTISEENVYRIGKFDDETGKWIINPWKQMLSMIKDGSLEQIIRDSRIKNKKSYKHRN